MGHHAMRAPICYHRAAEASMTDDLFAKKSSKKNKRKRVDLDEPKKRPKH